MAAAALAFVGASIGEAVIGGTIGAVVGGAIGGGIGSEASGGDFWQGALGGGISAGLGATDFLGMGEGTRSALGGLGLSEGATGMVMSGLQGGLTSSFGGGNFLEGALTGAVMPSVISGAKNIMGWGGAPTGSTYSIGEGGAVTPSMAGSSMGFENIALGDTSAAGSSMGFGGDIGMVGKPSLDLAFGAPSGYTPADLGSGGTGTSGGNFLSKFMPSSDTLIPAALNSGVNLYMNQQNAEAAKKAAAMADPYAQYRAGDAAKYNALLNNPNAIFEDPVYMAMAKQGDEAIMRQAAAMGKTDSGELTARISENRMALADQYYRNRLSEYAPGSGVTTSPAASAQIYSQTRSPNYLYGAMTSPLDAWGYNRGKSTVY